MMGFNADVYRILIASPGDVSAERRAIPEVIHAWNGIHAADLGVVLLPVLWESHSAPEMGDRPQAIINRQLVADCDMLIGAFWTRIGSHTGLAESGTVEEIGQFRAAGKSVMLYFSSQPVTPDSIDPDQYRRLQEFKDQCKREGLIYDYATVPELREMLHRHLLHWVRELQKAAGTTPAAAAAAEPGTQESRAMVREQFAAVLRRYDAEWAAERDSEPLGIDEGQAILNRLSSELLQFLPLLDGRVDEHTIELLNGVLKETRTLHRHQLFFDGGASYDYFWRSGTNLIGRLRAVLEALQQ